MLTNSVIGIINRLDIRNPVNLKEAGIAGTPPLNEKIMRKLFDYFHKDIDYFRITETDMSKLMYKELVAIVNYATLYGYEMH